MARELSTNNNNDYGGRFQKYDLPDKIRHNFSAVTLNFLVRENHFEYSHSLFGPINVLQASHILGITTIIVIQVDNNRADLITANRIILEIHSDEQSLLAASYRQVYSITAQKVCFSVDRFASQTSNFRVAGPSRRA